MTTIPTLNTTWTWLYDRDGTEDVAIIRDANGEDLVQSRHFWSPEEGDPTPPTLAAIRLMAVAPQLLAALKTVIRMQWNREERSRNFSEAFLEHFASLIDRAEGRE